MINQKDVTIIIPHLGKTKEQKYSLKQCLQSLDETVPDIKKVLVINGLQFEDDFETIRYPNVTLMAIEDQGQCKAVNAGVAISSTPWVLVTNDDMVYPPGWFELLSHEADKFQCLSPMLVEPRPGAPTFINYFCGGAGGDFDKQKFLEFAKHYKGWDFRTGFNLPFLITKELWNLVGGYDVNYDPWGSNSDSDLEYKIKLAGVQSVQIKGCLVYHFSQTSGTFEPKNQSAWNKNWEYFIEKWGFPRTDAGIWEATFEIPDEGRKFRPWWEGHYGSE